MIEAVKDIVKPCFHCYSSPEKTIILEEKDDSGHTITKQKLMVDKKTTYNIFKFPNEAEQIHTLLKDRISGLNKIPDYFIFCERNNEKYVLVFELKSKEKSDMYKQLKAGEVIAKYLIGMLELYKSTKINFEEINFRFIGYKKTGKNETGKTNIYKEHEHYKYQYSSRRYCENGENLEMFFV